MRLVVSLIAFLAAAGVSRPRQPRSLDPQTSRGNAQLATASKTLVTVLDLIETLVSESTKGRVLDEC